MLKPSLNPKLPLSRSRSYGPLKPGTPPKTPTSCHLGQRTCTMWHDSSSPGPMQKTSFLQLPVGQSQPGPPHGAPQGQSQPGSQSSPQHGPEQPVGHEPSQQSPCSP